MQRRSITRTGGDAAVVSPYHATPGAPKSGSPPRPKGTTLSDTIHLHDLSPVERLLEEAAERGFVEEKDIQALADEHELTEDDVTGLRAALEERDVVVREETPEETRRVAATPVTGTLDPLRELDLLGGGQELDLADVLEKELQRVGRDLAHSHVDPRFLLRLAGHRRIDDLDLELLERDAQAGDVVLGQLVLVGESLNVLFLDETALGGLLEQTLDR